MSCVAGHKPKTISQQGKGGGEEWKVWEIIQSMRTGMESHGRENSYDANDPVCYLKQGLRQAEMKARTQNI